MKTYNLVEHFTEEIKQKEEMIARLQTFVPSPERDDHIGRLRGEIAELQRVMAVHERRNGLD